MTNISIASTLLLTLVSASMPVVALAQTLSGRVVSVGDGDTLRVASGGKTLTVRLSCVDAPEKAQAPFGKASADRLRQLLPPGQQGASNSWGSTPTELAIHGKKVLNH